MNSSKFYNLFVLGLMGIIISPGHCIWPQPFNLTIQTSVNLRLSLCNISLITYPANLSSTADCMVKGTFTRALNLFRKVSSCSTTASPTTIVKLIIADPGKINVDPGKDSVSIESYKIQISNASEIIINAATPIAALRAAWTLFQIPEQPSFLILHPIIISDQPGFTYRSLLVDTTRSLSETKTERHSIKRLYEILDRMEVVKLNVLHWHLTDTDGISFSFRNMEAFEPYSIDDLNKVSTYAMLRGIAIIPEIDMVGHSGKIWAEQTHLPEFVAPDCPKQLNLDSTLAKTLVLDLFKEASVNIFPEAKVIGFGNDEVSPCGNDYRATFLALNNGINKIASDGGKSVMIWADTILDQSMTFNKTNTLVNVWKISGTGRWTTFPAQLNYLASAGYKIINTNSDHWYIGSDTDVASLYNYHPLEGVSRKYEGKVIGGSIALWEPSLEDLEGQYVLWPKSASFAEVLWSPRAFSSGNGFNSQRYDLIAGWIDSVETNDANPLCRNMI